ncbi:hypothetical protein ATCC5870_00377 [Lactobacillus plantarum]|nr:hypothetical protein [Lactiplantibacillus plantarum]
MARVRFENKRVNMSKLSQFGFEPNQNGQYQFRILIMQGQFEMIIELNTDGSLNTTLTDTTTSEVYVLHLTSQAHGQVCRSSSAGLSRCFIQHRTALLR